MAFADIETNFRESHQGLSHHLTMLIGKYRR